MQQLNAFGSKPADFNDDRGFLFTTSPFPTPTTAIVLQLPQNQGVPLALATPQSGLSVPAIEITASRQVPVNSFYELQTAGVLTNEQMPTVQWLDLPEDFVFSTPGPGRFRVTGPLLLSRWQRIRQPLITFPAVFHGQFANIQHILNPDPDFSPGFGPLARIWTQQVRFPYSLPYGFQYQEDINTNLPQNGGSILVSDNTDDGTKIYTVTISHSPVIGNLQFSAGGSSSVTTTGTAAQVNATLTTLNFLGNQDVTSATTLFYSQTRNDGLIQAANVAVALTSTGDLYDPVITRNFTEMHVQGGANYRFTAAGLAAPDNVIQMRAIVLTQALGGLPFTLSIVNNNGQRTLTTTDTVPNDGAGPYEIFTDGFTARPQNQELIFSNVFLATEMIGGAVVLGSQAGNLQVTGTPGVITMVAREPAAALTFDFYHVQNLLYSVIYRRGNVDLHGNIGRTLLEIARLNTWRITGSTVDMANANGVLTFFGYHGADGLGYNAANQPGVVARAYYRTGHQINNFPINSNHPNFAFNSVANINAGWTAVSTSNGQSTSPATDTQVGAPQQFSPLDISNDMAATVAGGANGTFNFTISYIWKRTFGPNPPAALPVTTLNLVKSEVGIFQVNNQNFWVVGSSSSAPVY